MTDKIKVVIPGDLITKFRREYTDRKGVVGINAYLSELFGRQVFRIGRFDANGEYFMLFDTEVEAIEFKLKYL